MKQDVDYAVNWGFERKYHPELYRVPLAQLRAETERLRTLTNQGSKYATSRLRLVQGVLDERVAVEEATWLQRHQDIPGGVHFHNNVTNAAPQSSPMSTAAALGLGAGAAALLFLAFSGVAVLAIFGLFAALLILAILGMAYLLHRDSQELPHYAEPKAPLFDTLQPLAVAPEPQALPAETQDSRRIEHKPVRAIATQKAVEATPLVRKSSEVSTVRHTSKDVKVS